MKIDIIIGRTLLAGAAMLLFAVTIVAGETASQSLRERSANLVAKVDYVVLNTVDAEGYPQARAVANLHKAGTKVAIEQGGKIALYFVTNRKSNKVTQFQNNPKASAYYLDLASGTSLLYTGKIEEVKDPAIGKTLWANWMKPLYQSSDNPDYMIIRLTVERIKIDQNGKSEQGEL